VLSSHNKKSKIDQNRNEHKTKVIELDEIKLRLRVHLKLINYIQSQSKRISYAG